MIVARKRIAADAPIRTLKARLTEEELSRLQEAHAPMSQIDAVRKIVLWFCDQDDVIRREIIGNNPQGLRVDIAKIVLERMLQKAKRAG